MVVVVVVECAPVLLVRRSYDALLRPLSAVQNLQDHLNVWQSFPTLDRSPLLAQPLLIFGWAATYLWSRRGPLASCALEGTAFLYTGLRPREDGPDLQIHFAPAAINSAVTKANGLAVRAWRAQPRWGGRTTGP